MQHISIFFRRYKLCIPEIIECAIAFKAQLPAVHRGIGIVCDADGAGAAVLPALILYAVQRVAAVGCDSLYTVDEFSRLCGIFIKFEGIADFRGGIWLNHIVIRKIAEDIFCLIAFEHSSIPRILNRAAGLKPERPEINRFLRRI